MGRVVSIILFISCLFILSSCTEKVSVDEKEDAVSSGERVIRIVFDLPGDDIGSPKYQAILHKMAMSIKDSGAGEILSSGFGMGSMEIVIKLKGEESTGKITEIIRNHYPKAKYSIKSQNSLDGSLGSSRQ